MATEFADEMRVAFGHQIQGVAQMQSRNRAARAAQFAIVTRGEHNGGAEIAFTQTPRHDAYHALVPVVAVGGDRHLAVAHLEFGQV